jgi:hypothetical protein
MKSYHFFLEVYYFQHRHETRCPMVGARKPDESRLAELTIVGFEDKLTK